MTTTRGVFVAVLTAVYSLSAPGGVGEWRNYTSMKDVRSVARAGTGYWAATGGGLFRWDEASNTFLRFTNADGLQSIDLTAVAVDSLGNSWSGSSNGYLQGYFPASHSFRIIPDIATTPQSNKQINSIVVYGDTALIATDFGLSFFRLSRLEFGDTYTKFGTIPRSNRVAVFSSAIYDAKIWAAVTDGQTYNCIAVANVNNPNLLPPEAWTLQVVGSAATVTRSLGVFNGRLYAGTTTGLFYFDGAAWTPVAAFVTKSIISIASSSSSLVVCTNAGEVYSVDGSNSASRIGGTLPFTPTSICPRLNGDPLVGALDGGLLVWSGTWGSVFPNGPNGTQCASVAVDPDGIVWCGSGTANGKGFYRFNGVSWKSFTVSNSGLPVNEYYRVSADCNGSIWASAWGAGIVEIPRGSDSVYPADIYSNNVGMDGIPGFPNYVVTGKIACDSHGNIWVPILKPANRRTFAILKPDGTWITTPVVVDGTPVWTLLEDAPTDQTVLVDASDNIWTLVRQGSYRGLVSLGNGGRIDSIAAYHLTVGDGLPSDDIRTIIVDRDNNIWVGTDKGIGIVLNPQDPSRTGSIAAYKPLSGLVINTIAVDALNQKWVGTSEGVVLLSPDGTQQLASYTVESTGGKLIDNDVKSIAVDPKTGTVYFGSNSGLASLGTPAVAPKAAFESLTVYPNPYRVPSVTLLTVDGLVENSSIKILTIDGRVIRDIKSPGGRVGFWDGKDRDGNDVASGIYIVVAYSEDGSQVANGKVAVLKQPR
jgi:ligand-binding sensor domain-containing protein